MSGPAGSFAGFGPRSLDFFKALAFHQDKAWFESNRAIYDEEVRAPLVALLAELTAAFAGEGLPLKAEPKVSIFRLHRDTRFGKDKRPYKTNSGAVLSRDGSKRSQGFLYLHLDPEGCFAAAGFYRPEPDELLAIRQRIAERPREYRALSDTLRQAGLDFAEMDALSRPPKGFEQVAEPEIGAALRLKSHVVREHLPGDAVFRADLRERLVAFALRAEPLLRFGWSAIDSRPPP